MLTPLSSKLTNATGSSSGRPPRRSWSERIFGGLSENRLSNFAAMAGGADRLDDAAEHVASSAAPGATARLRRSLGGDSGAALSALSSIMDSYDTMLGGQAKKPEPASLPSSSNDAAPIAGRAMKAAAFADPRYRTDAGYRKSVEKRLAQSLKPLDLDAPLTGLAAEKATAKPRSFSANPLGISEDAPANLAALNAPKKERAVPRPAASSNAPWLDLPGYARMAAKAGRPESRRATSPDPREAAIREQSGGLEGAPSGGSFLQPVNDRRPTRQAPDYPAGSFDVAQNEPGDRMSDAAPDSAWRHLGGAADEPSDDSVLWSLIRQLQRLRDLVRTERATAETASHEAERSGESPSDDLEFDPADLLEERERLLAEAASIRTSANTSDFRRAAALEARAEAIEERLVGIENTLIRNAMSEIDAEMNATSTRMAEIERGVGPVRASRKWLGWPGYYGERAIAFALRANPHLAREFDALETRYAYLRAARSLLDERLELSFDERRAADAADEAIADRRALLAGRGRPAENEAEQRVIEALRAYDAAAIDFSAAAAAVHHSRFPNERGAWDEGRFAGSSAEIFTLGDRLDAAAAALAEANDVLLAMQADVDAYLGFRRMDSLGEAFEGAKDAVFDEIVLGYGAELHALERSIVTDVSYEDALRIAESEQDSFAILRPEWDATGRFAGALTRDAAAFIYLRRALGPSQTPIGARGREVAAGLPVDIGSAIAAGVDPTGPASIGALFNVLLPGDPIRIPQSVADQVAARTLGGERQFIDYNSGEIVALREGAAETAARDGIVDRHTGVTHTGDGVILPSGATVFVDGSVLLPNNVIVDRRGTPWRGNDSQAHLVRDFGDEAPAALDGGRTPEGGSGATARAGAAENRHVARDEPSNASATGYELRHPEHGGWVPNRTNLSLEEAGLQEMTDAQIVERIASFGPIPPVRSRDDLPAFYRWLRERTPEDMMLIRIRKPREYLDTIDRRMRRASAINADATGASVYHLPGRHEPLTIASQTYLWELGIGPEMMTGARFTQPTSTIFRIPDDVLERYNVPSNGDDVWFRHDARSIEQHRLRPHVRAAEDELIGQARGDMHDEIELMIFLAARVSGRQEQRRALALGFRAIAERWYPDGVNGLPVGLQEMIQKEGLMRALPERRPAGGAYQVLLDAYDELARFEWLRDRPLRSPRAE